MRIALLADIHGNPIALDAVLAHIERNGGVDGYWILGDLCAIGFDPVGVLQRLHSLPNAMFIQGNADRYITTSDLPHPTIPDVEANPSLAGLLAEVAANFGWTRGYLDGAGDWAEWLRCLPLEYRLTLPDGTRVLLVHAAPGENDGYGLNPALTDEEVQTALRNCEEDLIVVGHFHMPMDRKLDGKRIINPGSVSNNFLPDLRASYAVLSATETSYEMDFYRVDYDREAVIDAIRSRNMPSHDYQVAFMRGNIRASWLERWDGVSHYPPMKT